MGCNSEYKKGFINSADCGPYTFRNQVGVYYMKDLSNNIKLGKTIVKENVLITSRTNLEQTPESQICAYRYNLGCLWRSPKHCLHPLHDQIKLDWRKTKKKSSLRAASIDIYYAIKETFPGCSFPMLGNLCSRMMNKEER